MGVSARSFAARVLRWYDTHGRHDLPWQHPRTAYRVWLAEVMLQQTQVATVIPYYQRFLARFPDIGSLAQAPLADVLQLWAGLGYYARARNLHRAAQVIQREHGGAFPSDFGTALALPGIGRSTAGAILAQAFDQRHPILDGNVRRVLARFHGIEGWPGAPAVTNELWRVSEAATPSKRVADYTQAIMDLGATCCTQRQPNCKYCPLAGECVAHATGRTTDIPAPRPRRVRPQRSVQVLFITRGDGAILLVQRPPAGIWGGLWSLPELPDSEASIGRFCREQLGYRVGRAKALETVQHAFTHFDLDIRPQRLRASAATPGCRESSNILWHAPGAPPPALPTPIRKLLEAHRA